MPELGSVLLSFSMGTSLLAIVAAALGLRRNDDRLLLLSRQACYLHFGATTLCVVILLRLLTMPDFSVVYVTDHVNLALPVFYRLTSLWAGQAGSMLWWNFLLVLFTVIAVVGVQKKQPVLVPYMIMILMFTSFFFAALGNFSEGSDPFRVITAGGAAVPQPDGRGLNPLLQHWAMIIHPPILYLGYVSFAIPFAIAMAALLARRINLDWTRLIRRWTIFSWFFLGTGILLGGKWAYEELGWGGYWAWDPVENASLMPWLTGTAFLHSIIVQEKRGMLKVWNAVLVSLSFLMCIFGTFLTRSGVVSSVHAFAKSNLGPFFVAFMLLIIVFCAILIIKRLPLLRSERPFNSFLSREAGFLFNNVLLILCLFTVIWGTMYPVFTETFFGQRVSVSAVWFNRWMAPLGLLILFLTGAGPLLAWRKTAPATLWRNFRFPLLAGLLTFALYSTFIGTLDYDHVMAGVSFSLVVFVFVGIGEEFMRTTMNRSSYTRENPVLAFVMILFQNKRRYIGYMIHIGLAVLFFGFTGKVFTKEARLKLECPGWQTRVGCKAGGAENFAGYLISIASFDKTVFPEHSGGAMPLYASDKLTINVFKDNKFHGSDTTEVRTYPMYNPRTRTYDDEQRTSEPAVISSLRDDVYVQYAGPSEDGRLVLQVWVNPLVVWVWMGFAFMTLFGLILLLPIGEGKVIRLFKRDFSVQPVKHA